MDLNKTIFKRILSLMVVSSVDLLLTDDIKRFKIFRSFLSSIFQWHDKSFSQWKRKRISIHLLGINKSFVFGFITIKIHEKMWMWKRPLNVFCTWLLSEVFSNSEKIEQLSWRNFPHIVFVELQMKYKKVEFCNKNN